MVRFKPTDIKSICIQKYSKSFIEFTKQNKPKTTANIFPESFPGGRKSSKPSYRFISHIGTYVMSEKLTLSDFLSASSHGVESKGWYLS